MEGCWREIRFEVCCVLLLASRWGTRWWEWAGGRRLCGSRLRFKQHLETMQSGAAGEASGMTSPCMHICMHVCRYVCTCLPRCSGRHVQTGIWTLSVDMADEQADTRTLGTADKAKADVRPEAEAEADGCVPGR